VLNSIHWGKVLMKAPDNARGERFSTAGLAVLLVASIASVLVMVMAGYGQAPAARSGPGLADVTLIGFLAGAVVFMAVAAGLALAALRRARVSAQAARGELRALGRQLATVEAAARVEAHALVASERGGAPVLVAHNLPGSAGVPRTAGDIMRPAAWLDAASAAELQPLLSAFLSAGRAFNLNGTALSGALLEIDGRIAGGRAILKIREASGPRRELAEAGRRDRRIADELRLCQALLDETAMPVWLRGADGRIEWVNQAYARSVGARNVEDVRSRQVELLEQRHRKALDQRLKTGRPYRERVHIVVAGELRAFDVTGVALGEASAAVATDVAAIETAQGELSRHMAANDRTLDRVSTAVAVYGPDQRLSFCNDAYRRLWKLDAEWLALHPRDGEILDRLRERRQLPDEADYRAWKAKQLACYGTAPEHEDWWHLPDGSTVHVVAEQRPDGGVTYLYDDVSEQLAMESRYNSLIGVQSETLDHLKEGAAVFATDGRLRLFNPAFARIWKLNPKDLEREPHIDEVVRRCRVLFDDERIWLKLKRAVTGLSDERQKLEGQMTRPDDSVIAYAGVPLPDGAVLLTFTDITDSKRVERALLEKTEALETADRLKSQFISHVSYELRTPLTNIIGFSELLASPRTGPLNGKQWEYLGDIGTSSRTLLAIINDILDLATIDAGAFELKLAPVPVDKVVQSAALGVRERIARARLSLDVAIAPDVTELVADEDRVKQVLYNLLSNAIGFSEPGDRVRLACERVGAMIEFSVEDEGPGIPEEQQKRVFERFESRARGSKHRGAGLGLALVKSLVELHGGEVSLRSEPGRGTRVSVRFPESPRSGGDPIEQRRLASSARGREAA
jgi:signal transduction histidine kinase